MFSFFYFYFFIFRGFLRFSFYYSVFLFLLAPINNLFIICGALYHDSIFNKVALRAECDFIGSAPY